MVTLWGRERTREELLPRAGRLEQIAGIRLAEGGDGAGRGARQLRCWPGAGLGSEILADRGFDIGGARIGGRPLAWSPPAGLAGHDAIDAFARGAGDLAGQVEAPT